MIPIRLKLSNFMCYRENVPPLDFTGIHTAVISGDNGNGKSALIDAMTWALWGKARARSDDELVTLGESEMEVEFTFASGKDTYRIIRKHSRPRRATGSGQTILEFQLASNGGFKPLTAEGVISTQRKIEEMLHMDYSTFINSALVLQGRADEFTVQTPSKRIQVLTNILGFTFYDELAEEARDRANALETEGNQLEKSISEMTEELALEPETRAELDRTTEELDGVNQSVKEQEARLESLRREKEALEAKERELAELDKRIQSAERSRQFWESQIAQHHSTLKEYREITARRPEIENSFKELGKAKRLDAELNQKSRETAMLSDKKHQLEMKIQSLSHGLLSQHALVQRQIAELEEKSGELARLRDEKLRLTGKAKEISGIEEGVLNKRKQGDELRAGIQGIKSTIAHLQQEIEATAEKMKLLAEEGNQCPLCESEIGEEGLKRVRAKFTAEKAEDAQSLKATQKELVQKQKGLEASEQELASLETKLNREKAELQRRESLIDRGISESEEAVKALAGARQNLSKIEESLAVKDYARSEETLLSQIEVEIGRLGYDSGEHDRIKECVKELELYDELKRKLDEADSKGQEVEKSLSNAEEAVREILNATSADNARKSELTVELIRLTEIKESLAQEEAEQKKLNERQRELQESVGKIKERLNRYAELRKRKTEKEASLKKTLEEAKIYRELSEAFGKKGIQTMLIELALPELEIEANRLLSKMTDNRMHLKFETQRQSRRGETLDTLDITISDELGTRGYEMYSGGEAFRINFAIRIALARLLARRAGAPLPTLVIDEGFGTQDTTGIEKIKEAIASIQDDFQKILVITHIEELRDAFPNRINVVKTAQGSTVEVS